MVMVFLIIIIAILLISLLATGGEIFNTIFDTDFGCSEFGCGCLIFVVIGIVILLACVL